MSGQAFFDKYGKGIALSGIAVLFFIFLSGFVTNRRNEKEIAAILAITDKNIDVEGDYKDLSSSDAFNPNAHNKLATFTQVDVEKAIESATKLYKADGIVDDDEDGVYVTIKSAGTIAFMSLISDEFQKEYSKDLLTYLNSFLDGPEMNKVKDIVSQLS